MCSAITDFVGAASKIAQRDGRTVEMYTFVAVVYFVLCVTLSYAVKYLQKTRRDRPMNHRAGREPAPSAFARESAWR